jgi:two-component system LytT family response regulator
MTHPPRIRALVVDDEALARRRLRTLLKQEPRIEIVGEAASGRSALQRIEELKPDLIFLDVQMPGVDGFEVVRRIDADKLPLVVFVTAFDEHAVRAFEVNALDYLLKPVAEARFSATVERVLDRLREPDHQVGTRVLSALEELRRTAMSKRIPVPSGSGVAFVPVQDLDWAEVVDDYVRLHVGGSTHILRETLTQLEQRLPAVGFLRIHRSTLVNLDRIREIQPWLKGDFVLILRDGTRLVSGRTYRERVQRLLR